MESYGIHYKIGVVGTLLNNEVLMLMVRSYYTCNHYSGR